MQANRIEFNQQQPRWFAATSASGSVSDGSSGQRQLKSHVSRKPSIIQLTGISDPFIPPKFLSKEVLPQVFPKQGVSSLFRQWRQRFVKALGSFYCQLKVRSAMKEFKSKEFALVVGPQLYVEVKSALVRGNRSALRSLVTEFTFSKLKNTLKKRSSSEDLEWSLHSIVSSKLVHASLIRLQDFDKEFAQITLRIESLQSLTIYDADTKTLLRGSEQNKPQKVVEFVVFERPIRPPPASAPHGGWLYAGTIDPLRPPKALQGSDLFYQSGGQE